MVKTFTGACGRALLAVATFVAPAVADYLFSVPREVVVVTVNPDSSLDIDYKITFECSTAGDAIDVVDIGFPTDDYELDSVTADIDGAPLTDIRESEYIKTGVEIHLGSHSISPGETGTLHVHGRNPRMVYRDSTDKGYASCVFSPTWFGSEYTTGSTHLTMVFVFPPGVTGEQSRWHENQGGQPTDMFIKDGRVHYVWDWPSARPDEQYFFGISFPRTAVTEVRTPSPFTGWGKALKKALENIIAGCACFAPLGLILTVFIGGAINSRRRRMQYLPPRAKVEGVGIKRGLTAPEAALLLEVPLNKILTMILFGLAKKGAVAVTSRDPLLLKKLPFPQNGLREYEKGFLAAIDEKGKLNEKELTDMIVAMVKDVARKMKGFSHKETVAYYRSIVATAWRLVSEAKTPDVKAEEFTNSLEWTMLDENFDDRTREIFAGYNIPRPLWWGNIYPSTPSGGGDISFDMPTLPGANFANAVVTQVEGITNRIVNKLETFTGRVTAVTNPPPVVTYSSGSGSGGHSSCACACACAGCACACAGGGR